MAQSTKASGNPISIMVEVSFTMQVVISTRANSLMTWLRASVSIGMPMALSMWDTGTRINSTASAKRSGMMVASTKVSTRMLRKKAKVSTAGLMATDTSVNGATTC